MKKVKYYYNTSSLRYEKVEETWRSFLLRIFGFLCAITFFALIVVVFAFKFLPSPQEKHLERDLAQVELKFLQMNKKLQEYQQVVEVLQDRDENIYRTIFEASPIPASVREAGFGGGDRFKHLEAFNNSALLIETAQHIEKVGKQLYIQSKSYDDIAEMVRNKEDMLASIPAIQPIANKDLKRLASGFGMRMHPIYKRRKMHTGIDFSAPTGTPIHATGKGKVVKVVSLKKSCKIL